jgi:hypothetical protein
MERNMKTAAAQSIPSCSRKKLCIDSGMGESVGVDGTRVVELKRSVCDG